MLTTLKTTHPVARKVHRCDFCYGKIEPGQRYIRETNICDGDIYDWLEHEECSDLCRELDMWSDCDPDYGISSELFQEIVDQAIYDTFSEEVIEAEWDNLSMYEKVKKFLNYLKTEKEMTDQELKDLAQKYAEENPPQTEDEVLKQNGIELNARMVFEPFLRWLTKKYCIVSRENVKALRDNIHGNIMYAHNEEDWQEAAHYILDVMPRRFTAIFGTELFEERSGE